jgi:hypothetical protein
MKTLSAIEAASYLDPVGMKVGDWNEIANVSGDLRWIKQRAPKESLLGFSQHVAGWLPKSKWKIFQVDNSTWMDPVEASFFGGLLFGAESTVDINSLKTKTFLFEFGNSKEQNDNTELLISNLIYVFLLFSSHGYVVSSNEVNRRVVGVQDGFVYFGSGDDGLASAKVVLKQFEDNALVLPQWVTNIIVERQERAIAGDRKGIGIRRGNHRITCTDARGIRRE